MTFRWRRSSAVSRHRTGLWVAAIAAIVSTTAAACGQQTPAPAAVSASAPAPDPGHKVMIVAEENHGYGQIIGNSRAPYINRLATTYGSATRYDAGYPARCPSLAAYVLMTSGGTGGICDDNDPAAHPLAGDNVFHQVSASGRQWRDYAESATANCELSGHGRYLVRHVPATYYRDERANCRRWSVPLDGNFPSDIAGGVLPAFSFVSPDACHDMHGAGGCSGDLVAAGDQWLQTWLTRVMAGPDYRSGRLTVIVTWDEGTSTSNHIPTILVGPTLRHVSAGTTLTHCSTLRFVEEQLRLPLLGCAARATSLGPAFGI